MDKDKKKRGRVENLQPVRTKAEARERGRKGGIASGKARAQAKTFREALEWALSLPAEMVVGDKIGHQLSKQFPGITAREAIAISAATAAIKKQDVKAMAFARDTMGEAPAQQVELNQGEPFEILIKTVDNTGPTS